MADLADALNSNSSVRKDLWVQLPTLKYTQPEPNQVDLEQFLAVLKFDSGENVDMFWEHNVFYPTRYALIY